MNKIIDIKETLKLVVHNKKIQQAKANKRGSNAVNLLKLYNTDCEKLCIVENDLLNNRISQSTHNYIQWFLEEFLTNEPDTPIEEIMYSWAKYLLEYLKAGNAKVYGPRTKPKKPIPPNSK